MHAGRTIMALLVSVVAIPIGIWAILVAALALMHTVLSLFITVDQDSWTRPLNPAPWLGWPSTDGAGRVLGNLLGGPGSPGGPVSPLLTALLGVMLAAVCLLAVTWAWDQARTGKRI